jgi:hypothetical protein
MCTLKIALPGKMHSSSVNSKILVSRIIGGCSPSSYARASAVLYFKVAKYSLHIFNCHVDIAFFRSSILLYGEWLVRHVTFLIG